MKFEKGGIWIIFCTVLLSLTPSFASNPSSHDSDNDGIPDGWEIKYGLDPEDPNDINQDYNNNGLTNIEEYARGFDPYNRDTDNDKISNYAEVKGLFGFVTDPLNTDTDGDGLTDLEEIATYIGVNTSQLFVEASVIEDLKRRYPYALDPTDPDVDDDGLLDGEEISRGTSPTNLDSDTDGLTDYEEVYKYNTNPANVDTDGDWLPDKEEVTAGTDGFITDPNCQDTDGDGITDGEEVLAVAQVMIYPSKHALTYEEFIADNAYAGEYVTFKARVGRIYHEPLDMNSYYIQLKPLNLSTQSKRGIVHVGNPWHYDPENDLLLVDEVFGYVLREGDVIVVTGVAGKFEGMSRAISVKTNCNDAEGSIYLLLDPEEAASRISVYELPSPLIHYPFWSHVKLVSFSTNYASWQYVNLTTTPASPSNNSSNVTESNNIDEVDEKKLTVTNAPKAEENIAGLLIYTLIVNGILIVALLSYKFIKRRKREEAWLVSDIRNKGYAYEVAVNKDGKRAIIKLNERLYRQLIKKKRLVLGNHTIVVPQRR